MGWHGMGAVAQGLAATTTLQGNDPGVAGWRGGPSGTVPARRAQPGQPWVLAQPSRAA